MLKLTTIRKALPVAVLTLATAFSTPAHASDWGVLSSVVNFISQLFFTPPQPVPQMREPVNTRSQLPGYKAPGSQYGSYDPGSSGYPIPSSRGLYQYVGPNGETYTVDNSRPSGSQQNQNAIVRPDPQGGLQVNNTGIRPGATYGGGNYPWPTVSGPISSTYGNRERVGRMCHKDDAGTGTTVQHCGVHPHNGMDLAVPSGTSINSITGGKVVWVSPACKGGAEGEAGCTVSVMNPEGEMSTYMHLTGTRKGLKVGDDVGQGDQIALSGNSGTATTGAHLHFEMCKIPPGKADGKTSPRELCAMGERINPLSKLSKEDPRYANACKMSERNPLNANIKPPCAYKPKVKKGAKKKITPTTPPPEPVDTRQSTVVKGLYGN